MWEELKEMVSFLGFGIAIVAVFAFAIIIPMNYYTEYQCDNYRVLTGKRTEYVQFDSCYVEHKGNLMRWSVYEKYMTAGELKVEKHVE